MRYLISLVLLFVAFACQKEEIAPKPVGKEVRWVRQSVEYDAICQQVYRQAWLAVKATAAKHRGNWAVVLDIDETVLDNSRYQEMLYEQDKSYPWYWADWCYEEKCPPVPGVKAFLDSVRALGEQAQIVYITNRADSLEGATISNMMKVGLWDERDVMMCRKSREDTKEVRRQEVRDGAGRCQGKGPRQIVALIGDQLPDMLELPEAGDAMEMKAQFLNTGEWGTRFFILPNPTYGYWETGY